MVGRIERTMESSISTNLSIKLPIEIILGCTYYLPMAVELRLNECGILFGDKQSKEVDNITHIINVFPPYFC